MKTLMKGVSAAALMLLAANSAFALEEGKLVIWMDSRDNDLLAQVAAGFTADLGVEVVIENVDPLTDKFQQAASTGDGPDIVLWAHDRFGEWAAGGLIQAVEPGDDFVAGNISSAWDAVQFSGKTWGYPVAVEAVALVYNKDLIDSPPATFEEIVGMEVDGATTIMWDYNNTYFTMPLLMANGGYAFQKVDGVYDGSQTGVNNDGAVMGASMVLELISSGTMPEGVDYGIMDGAMNKGEVAMVINGPWSWGGFDASGINYGVAPLPSVNGQPSPAFLGVQAFAINAASPNKDLAVELLENYVLTDEGLAVWNANSAMGALTDISAGAAQNDDRVSATLAGAAVGIPMPSNPEMGAFWGAMGPALSNITTGAASVEDALNDAAARILGM